MSHVCWACTCNRWVWGPRVVVGTAAFHARVRGSVPGLGDLKETKMFFPHPRVKVSIVGSLRDREVACSASDRQGSNFESCVWRTVSSQSSHHPHEVLLAQFSLYVHKGGQKPNSFKFYMYQMSKVRRLASGVVHITVLQIFQMYVMCSAVLSTIKNHWSHSIRVGRLPDFGLPSVAILPWLCRKWCKMKWIGL